MTLPAWLVGKAGWLAVHAAPKSCIAKSAAGGLTRGWLRRRHTTPHDVIEGRPKKQPKKEPTPAHKRGDRQQGKGLSPPQPAELLDVHFHVAPCPEGAEETTPAIRFPVEKIDGLNRTQKKSLGNITMKKAMGWYHAKCEAAGVPDHKLHMPHSFRISGATILFGMGVTEEEIKAMGRWASDCYRIYCRLSKERLLELSQKMGSSQPSQFVNGSQGFLGTLMQFEPVEKRSPDDGAGGAAAAVNGGEPTSAESESGAESEQSDCMSDGEFEELCGTAAPTPPEVEMEPTLESLLADDDGA